jgi:hypothetical protein
VAKKRKRRKGKYHGVFRRALGRWAWGKVHSWAGRVKARSKKTFGPKVIHSSAKQHQWQRRFPDPRRQAPLPESMQRVEEWQATFTVLLDNGWEVSFEVDIHDHKVSIREAAYDAAARVHGEVARSRLIADITPTNQAAEDLLLEER